MTNLTNTKTVGDLPLGKFGDTIVLIVSEGGVEKCKPVTGGVVEINNGYKKVLKKGREVFGPETKIYARLKTKGPPS